MGTNFYLLEKPACDHCGRGATEGLHIGKSSGGWCFSLHVYPPDGRETYKLSDYGLGVASIMSPKDWEPLFKKYGVIDEYGRQVEPDEMMSIITDRLPTYGVEVDVHRRYYPNQPPGQGPHEGGAIEKDGRCLIRHQVDHSHCIGIGDGTWDMIVGEFS